MTAANLPPQTANHTKHFYTDASMVATTVQTDGKEIIYLRDALYPAVEAQIILREKSREQLGDIERTILQLIQQGIVNPDSIAYLMGLERHKLLPLIRELEGRNLIEWQEKSGYILSELGQLSVSLGVQVIEVERAVLLCGITGKLLPKEAYNVSHSAPDELSGNVYHYELMEESHKVPLTELDISKIPDKRAVNLPDEALSVEKLINYKPQFLKGVFVLYRDSPATEHVEVYFGRKAIDWLNPLQIVKHLEPLGYAAQKTPAAVLAEIATHLQTLGAEIQGKGNLDTYGNPVFNLGQVNLSFKQERLRSGHLLLLHLGTPQYQALPIGRFPLKGTDLLYGRTLTLNAVNRTLRQEVEILRTLEVGKRAFSNLPRHQRPQNRFSYLKSCLERAGFTLESARSVVETIGYQGMLRELEEPEE